MVQNKWSVSGMRKQRWETLGKVGNEPMDSEIIVSESAEETQSLALSENARSNDRDYMEGPVHEGPDWGEMVKREEVSVVFQGSKGGGKVERLFGTDGLDETAIDTCEIYVQEDGKSVDKTIEVEACEDMGRIRSAANFIGAIEGTEAPLNTPEQALSLMRTIDAIYASASSGTPIAV
ncbi:Gfo/Idh/MocA family oxidoreductase [bacterium]|nr:Gfo/Idh/MocA family oxidoreductase [bacterium]